MTWPTLLRSKISRLLSIPVGKWKTRASIAYSRIRITRGQNLVEQLPGGEWVERAPYFEAIAVNGDGVFDTLKAVSKLVLKALA